MDRFRHVADWFALRRTALTGRPTTEWLPLFEKVDVPAAICHTLESLVGDAQLAAVGLLVPEQHPTEGTISSIRPTRSWRRGTAGEPARQLGEDTEAVLVEAGLSQAEVAALTVATSFMMATSISGEIFISLAT